jgi:hypothetical protein
MTYGEDKARLARALRLAPGGMSNLIAIAHAWHSTTAVGCVYISGGIGPARVSAAV